MDRLLVRPDTIHARVRCVRWPHHCTWFVGTLLAVGFLVPGLLKVLNMPFTREEGLGDIYVVFTAPHQDFGALYVVIGVCRMAASPRLPEAEAAGR